MSETRNTRRDVLTAMGAAAALLGGGAGGAALAQGQAPAAAGGEKVLKIGVLGVMRGPAASWGLVNRYSAETTAEMYNEQGGVDIGGQKYRIEIRSIDDQLDPKLAIAGAEVMTREEDIRYIIGPNVDTTAAVIVPTLRTGNAVNIAYAFARYLYTPPQRHSILGMIASYQASPIIYDYLRQNKGVRSISFVARNEADSLNQRDENVIEARRHGLVVVSSSYTYDPGTLDFRPVMARVLAGRDKAPVLTGITGQIGGPAAPMGGTPDLIELSGVAPADAPLILIALRELGYKGLVCTETGQDALLLRDAGEAAEGFIARDAQPLHGGVRAALHRARRPLARRGRDQGLRARDDPAHAAGGGAEGDRGRQRVHERHARLRHRRPVPQGEADPPLRRRGRLQPAAADRGAARGQRVPRRRVPAAIRRLGRVADQSHKGGETNGWRYT
jgi:hypothetical protein